MARLVGDSGLFTLTEFRNRGVIKLAPDALVYISGDVGSVVVAPATGTQNVDFNDGITSISIQNAVDPPGSSSATVEITTPIYGEKSKYWISRIVDGKNIRVPVFAPMMEIKIFLKGRYLVNGEPKYYPSFWGFINNVEENFSGGVYKISLQCVDMLHWWAYSQVNIHPVPASNVAFGGGQRLTAFKTIFKDQNPFTIMWRLATDMFVPDNVKVDNVVEAAAYRFITPTWVAQKTGLQQIYPPQALKAAATGIMSYWRERFSNMATLLKMYGAYGERIIGDAGGGNKLEILKPDSTIDSGVPDSSAKKEASHSLTKDVFDVTQSLKQFTVFFEYDKMGEFTDAEYMSKLDIATEIKNRVEYEFFQDVDGNFIFKPPFYNMDVRNVEPYIIRPYDTISASFQIDSEAIVTVLQVKTPFQGQLRESDMPQGIGFHMDIELAQRYGIRFKEMALTYIKSDARVANQLAVGHMGLINAKATSGTVVIPGRPELRLGYPVYMDYRDSFHYVKSINHSFDFGGSFTTSLSLEAERKRVYDYDSGDLLKDKIYIFTNKLSPEVFGLSENDVKKQEIANSTSRYNSISQGRYKIADRENASQLSITGSSVPFTDGDGYRVIGSYMYGRGIVVSSSTKMDPSDIELSKQQADNPEQEKETLSADKVSRIVPESSARESEIMGEYFKKIPGYSDTETKPGDRDGIVPSFLNTRNFGINIESESNQNENLDKATNMTPSNSINQPSDELLEQAARNAG